LFGSFRQSFSGKKKRKKHRWEGGGKEGEEGREKKDYAASQPNLSYEKNTTRGKEGKRGKRVGGKKERKREPTIPVMTLIDFPVRTLLSRKGKKRGRGEGVEKGKEGGGEREEVYARYCGASTTFDVT